MTVPRTGRYLMSVYYGNQTETIAQQILRVDSGAWSFVDYPPTLTSSGGTSQTVYARNTYSWDQFGTIEVTVRLNAGLNTITFGNPDAYAPNFDKITVAQATLP